MRQREEAKRERGEVGERERRGEARRLLCGRRPATVRASVRRACGCGAGPDGRRGRQEDRAGVSRWGGGLHEVCVCVCCGGGGKGQLRSSNLLLYSVGV